LYWQPVYNGDTKIAFAMACQCSGWFSVGWSPTGNMLNSDAVIGSINSTTVLALGSYQLPEDSVPLLDLNPTLKLYNVSGMVSDGISIIMFTRDISSGFNPLNISQYIIGAYHPTSTTLVYHETYHSTQMILADFLSDIQPRISPEYLQPLNLRDLHGMMMMSHGYFYFWEHYLRDILAGLQILCGSTCTE